MTEFALLHRSKEFCLERRASDVRNSNIYCSNPRESMNLRFTNGSPRRDCRVDWLKVMLIKLASEELLINIIKISRLKNEFSIIPISPATPIKRFPGILFELGDHGRIIGFAGIDEMLFVWSGFSRSLPMMMMCLPIMLYFYYALHRKYLTEAAFCFLAAHGAVRLFERCFSLLCSAFAKHRLSRDALCSRHLKNFFVNLFQQSCLVDCNFARNSPNRLKKR